MLEKIRIVLVNTSHSGNIGAVARAMKNMCLSDLVLVAPRQFPSEEAIARSSGANDILAKARVCATLDEAISDCHLVIGASARLRSVQWPQFDPRECAAKALAESANGPVAIVFGRESSGLTNEELERCAYLVHIPANPDYTSLNVAMAVQVIAYELRMAGESMPSEASAAHQPVAAEELQRMFDHLEQALEDVGFSDPRRSDKLMRRLKRLFHRAAPDKDEINILRGFFSAAQGRKSMRRGG